MEKSCPVNHRLPHLSVLNVLVSKNEALYAIQVNLNCLVSYSESLSVVVRQNKHVKQDKYWLLEADPLLQSLGG